MQKEDDFELNIQDKAIEEKIIALFQEIKEGIVLESNDILDDLNPLMSNLCDQDKNKVVQALNKHFRDYEFLKSGNYWLQEEIDPNKEEIDYISFYESDRENNNYESILDYLKVPEYRRQNQIPIEFFANLQLLIKLKIKSLLVFDLLDYNLDKKDLTQIEILKILLELFYCNQMFTDDEQKTFEQVIGSLLQKQIYEVQYYMENLEKDDPQNFRTFVQNFLQKLQLKCISETDSDLQTFLQANQRYRMLLMSFNKEIINLRSHLQQQISSLIQIPVEQCQFVQIISYISDIENNDQLNDMYLQTVFYYWKKYCIKYNLQNDLKIQEDSLSKLPNNERKLIFIERYLQKQKSKIQDTIYLFVIHRICYYMEKIDNILCSDQYEKVIKTMTKNMEVYQSKKQYPMYKILKDNSKFMEYWKIIQSLRFYKQEKVEQNNQTANLITNLLWIYNQNVSLFNILNKITQIKKQTFKEYAILIYEEIIQIKINCDTNLDTHILQKNFLRIIYAISPKEENNYLLLRNLHDHYGSLLRAPLILEANFFINSRLDQKSISFFAKIGRKFIVIHNVFPTQTLQNLAYDLVNYLMSNNKSMIQECLQSLKCIFAIKSLVLPEDLQPIQKLIENFSINALEHLIVINKSQNISLSSVKLSIYAIFCYFQKVGQSLFAKVEQYLQKIFKDKCYYFPFVFQCLRNKISIEKINKIVELQYSFCFYNEDSLLKLCQEVFQQDEQLYQEWLKIQKPSQVMLSIEYLKIKKSQQFYPKKMDIPLEDFNISLSEYSEQEQKQVFSNWIQDMTDSQKFKQIIPLFFNIIKRGESPQDVLILANQTLQKDRKIADGIGCLNLKSLFQIFFNNANDELKFILMKFFSKEFPIPFLYQNPILDNLNSKTELLLLNSNLFYFFDQGYTIINLSLSQNQKKIGKTDLINKIFYQREKFETSDSCLMNSNTIDIMFDFEFNNSRNFIVADAHGQIIFEILLKILPFFQFWIVQMDSQQEIQENINQLRKILQQMDQQTKDQVEICFIVRNTVENELMIEQPFSQEIESKEVQIIYIQNLAANQIDKQFKISQIQDVSKFLFNLIFEHQKKLQQSKQMLQNKNNQFLLILQKFNQQYSNNIQQITSHNNLIKKIEEALNQLVNEQDGFYSQNAFPIRRILWNIKKLRQQNYELCTKPQENKNDILRNRQQISELEEQIDKQSVSNLLKLFSEIFSLKHYYIIYLWIVDKIRQFNQKNLIDLQQRDYELNEQFKKLKQEKQKIKQKYLNDLEKQCEDPRNKEIKLEMSQVKQQMDNNATSISHKNVGIELFWRELISLRKFINYALEFDPVETLSQLIRKGESLEFLDGDTLSINIEFLFELEKKITQNNQIKILVISILGPQSSGKSTILNKIFGCHFWASVGRCTKGIHLQILQVQNKQLFQNRFDQILILDTEGLQNPNQSDPEFDKKIALFVLSISDIIIINVKGEINQQFKNLVEMCIFTLGHLKNGLQMFKQLSWFFNQNDNYKNVEPFRQQIKDLAQNLNLEWDQNNQDQQEEQIDYADILDIKDNISGLGFASDQKDWGKNGWNQSVNNNTFSREAYKQGINMIKRFIQKLEEQTNSFDHFLKNVQRNWESIEKLPDLLEFSELIQHQQNLMMKKYFDDLWKMQNITQVADNLTQRTLKKIQNLKQIVFDTYKQILLEKENEIESTYTQIKNQIEERMNIFRNENKISKKIMQKYLKKLESMIQTVEIECKLKLQNIIENYEGEYQQKKGYVQIDNFIQVVLSDEFLKKKFQGNKEAIEQEFKKKWDQFIAETERSSENQYLKMVESQYKAIKFISNKYNLNTKNEQDYINYFREEIIKQNPNDQKIKNMKKYFNFL
ncbi:unnamed protein product [Paramecium octaurelia]|uniref:VLIG-type G domain-containing protein n=1 Tax=Paramecium octaurelia TaxID=43137 RepID=A0A8S1UWK3_PAROT|nr:unnamed protein product [Paramecium octaurelia]